MNRVQQRITFSDHRYLQHKEKQRLTTADVAKLKTLLSLSARIYYFFAIFFTLIATLMLFTIFELREPITIVGLALLCFAPFFLLRNKIRSWLYHHLMEDIRQNYKYVIKGTVTRMFSKHLQNNTSNYYLEIDQAMTVRVEQLDYTKFEDGDPITVSFTPNYLFLFSVK